MPSIPERTIAEGEEKRKEAERKQKSDSFAEERRESREEFTDLSGTEAAELAEETVSPLLRPVNPAAGITGVVDRPTPETARVDVPGQARDAIVQTPLPQVARTDDGQVERLDYELKRSGSRFEPKNALVDMSISSDPLTGAALEEVGIAVRPTGSGGAEGLQAGEGVLYPEVEADTDLIIKPVPEGLETFHQLRSQESPEELSLDLRLEPGDDLRELDANAAEVRRGGKRVMRITPPTAFDANHQAVKVSMSTEGDRLVFKIAHRGKDLQYPLTLDPVMDTYYWYPSISSGYAHFGFVAGSPWKYNYYTNQGLYILNNGTNYQYAGEQAYWAYIAPPDAWIDYVRGDYLWHEPATNVGSCAFVGINHPTTGAWQGDSPIAACYSFWPSSAFIANAPSGTRGNYATFGLQFQYSGWSTYWAYFVGRASIRLQDDHAPAVSFPAPGVPSTWVTSPTATIGASASDPGVGVRTLKIHAPTDQTNFTASFDVTCTGTYNNNSPCPSTRSGSTGLTNRGAGLPDLRQGSTRLRVNATDPVGNSGSTADTTIKFDTKKPNNDLSGSLWTNRANPLTGSSYSLAYAANDRDLADTANGQPTGSGIKSVEVLVTDAAGAFQRKHFHELSSDGQALSDSWTMNPEDFSVGAHTVRVITRDRVDSASVDHAKIEDFQITIPPRVRQLRLGDAAGAPENSLFTAGDIVSARGDVQSGKAWKARVLGPTGGTVHASACTTAPAGSGDAAVAPSYQLQGSDPVSTADPYRYELSQYASLADCGTNTSPASASKPFSVAKAASFEDSGLATARSRFKAGATAFLRVSGMPGSVSDWTVGWVRPGGVSECRNTSGSDRPDASAAGLLPHDATGLRYASTASGDAAWNLLPNYEQASCAALGSSTEGAWKLKLETGSTRFVELAAFTVDTTAPTAPTFTQKPAAQTNSQSATFAISPGESGGSLECKLDSGSYSACTSPKQLTGLAAGEHTFSARQIDEAGNAGAAATYTWLIDRTLPATTDDVPATYRNAPVAVTLEATDAGGAGVDKTYFTTGASPAEPTTSSDVYDPGSKPTLDDGERIKYFTVDRAGNAESAHTSDAAKVDLESPITTDDVSLEDANPGHVTLSPTDTGGSGLDETYYTIGQSPPEPTTSSSVYDPANKPVLSGGDEIRYFSVDVAGNEEGVKATGAPETTIASGPALLANLTSASFQFSSEADSTYECRLDGAAWSACTSPKALSGLAEGWHSFHVRARDVSGNTDPVPAAWNWNVDTTAPNVEISSGPSGVEDTRDSDFTFTSDDPAAQYECSLDGSEWENCSAPRHHEDLAEGGHRFEVRARDAANNIDATPASRIWTVGPDCDD